MVQRYWRRERRIAFDRDVELQYPCAGGQPTFDGRSGDEPTQHGEIVRELGLEINGHGGSFSCGGKGKSVPVNLFAGCDSHDDITVPGGTGEQDLRVVVPLFGSDPGV